MGDVLKKYGRFFLLDKIAQGGMAEIYRARPSAVGQAVRILVIKRISGGYGENKDFLNMFEAETNVMMQFQHPNIIALYDSGEIDGKPYLAMEYVDGRNLRQLSIRFKKKGQKFPIDLAAFIVEQAAAGLHYAHSFKDKIEQKSLNVVHRDVSPQNILVSYEGLVKVIDFGIAKAATNNEATRAGTIKGKPSYMSPEQVNGESLDGRSDIFSLGTVLWELLTGKKLFGAKGDLAILRMIENCEDHIKPPSAYNKDIPKELDYIVMRALAKSRDKRYRSAEELQRELRKFLVKYNSDFNQTEMSYLVKDLFKEEIVEDRKNIQRLNEKAEQLISYDLTEPSLSRAGKSNKDRSVVLDQGEGTKVGAQAIPAKKRSFEGVGEGGLVLDSSPASDVASSDLGGIQIQSNQIGRPRSRAANRVSPMNGETKLKSATSTKIKSKSQFSLARLLAAAVVVAAIVGAFVKPQFVKDLPSWVIHSSIPFVSDWFKKDIEQDVAKQDQTKNNDDIEDPDSLVVEDSLIEPPTKVVVEKNPVLFRVRLGRNASDAKITLNGQELSSRTPFAKVTTETALELIVKKKGYLTYRETIVIKNKDLNSLQRSPAGNLRQYNKQVDLKKLVYGFLTLRSTPTANVRFFRNGRQVGGVYKTPFKGLRMVPGQYVIRLENEILKMERVVQVTIDENRETDLRDISLKIKGP